MKFVSFSGRIGRADYFAATVLLYIVGFTFMVLIEVGAPNAAKDIPTNDIPAYLRGIVLPSTLGWTALLIGVIGFLFAALVSISVRRLHDFGLTGFLVLLFPVLAYPMRDVHWPDFLPGPAALLWHLIMIAQPGTRGANAFGPGPSTTPVETAPPDSDDPPG